MAVQNVSAIAPGDKGMVEIAPGLEIPIRRWTKREELLFDLEYPILAQQFTRDMPSYLMYDRQGGNLQGFQKALHPVTEVYMEPAVVRAIKLIGQSCAELITPNPGQFNGMNATGGYGMQLIRPDYMVPTGQGRSFMVTTSGLTAAGYYGLYHNGAIGAAYNATPLYLRKELGIAWVGLMEVNVDICRALEVGLEIDGKPKPLYNLLPMLANDGKEDISGSTGSVGDPGGLRAFRFPQVQYLQPSIQYRSQYKTKDTGGFTHLIPLGVAFPTAEFMRATAATQPSTTKP